jgi:hypothetical protein
VNRLKADFDASSIDSLRTLLADRGMRAPVSVPAESRVRVHRFKVRDTSRLIAFERNVEYKIREELAQVGGNEQLEKPVVFKAKLQQPGHVVNLRTGEHLGEVSEFSVSLDPWQPALFAVMSGKPTGDAVEALLGQLPSP